MSIESSPAKPTILSKILPSQTDSQKDMARAATNIDKPQPADKNAAILAAANTKVENLQSLIEELASPSSIRRAEAARELGRIADASAVPALIATLEDDDADVAREAATSLGMLQNASAVEPLIAVLNNRDGYFHGVVRIAAIHSLGQLRDLRAVVPLMNAIRDPIAEASAEAIRAVASLPDPRALPALLEVIRNEHGFFLPITRRAAILGLAKTGGEQAVCELRFVASNQWEDAVVRAAAIEAIRAGAGSSASD
jgi:HEAT repeat protein